MWGIKALLGKDKWIFQNYKHCHSGLSLSLSLFLSYCHTFAVAVTGVVAVAVAAPCCETHPVFYSIAKFDKLLSLSVTHTHTQRFAVYKSLTLTDPPHLCIWGYVYTQEKDWESECVCVCV